MRKVFRALWPAFYGAGSMGLILCFPDVAGVLFGIFMLIILLLAFFT